MVRLSLGVPFGFANGQIGPQRYRDGWQSRIGLDRSVDPPLFIRANALHALYIARCGLRR